MLKKISRRENIYVLILFFSTFFFGLLYVNRFVTDVTGWNMYCAELHHMGKMPYRDFYYYVPPAYLLKLELLWFAVGKNMLWLRVTGLVERALIFCLLYKVLERVTKPIYAFIATYFSFLVEMSSNFDSFGDYTQFCRLFVLFAALTLAKYLDKSSKRYSLLYCAGTYFWIAQAIMTKQSTGIVLLAAITLFLIIYILCQHRGCLLKVLTSSFAGLGIGLLPWFIWLRLNLAYDQFIDQVFTSALGAKGLATSSSITDSVIIKVLIGIFNWKYLLIGVLIFIVFLHNDYGWKYKLCRKICNLCVFFAGALCLVYVLSTLDGLGELLLYIFQNRALVCCLGVIITAFLFARKSMDSDINKAILYSLAFSLSWVAVTFITEKEVHTISSVYSVTNILAIIGQISIMVELVFCARYVLLGIRRKLQERGWLFFSILVVGLSTAVASLLGAGALSFSSAGVQFIIVPAFLVQLLSWTDKCNINILKKNVPTIGMTALLCLATLLIMCKKIDTPYSWWGWNNIVINDEASYEIDEEMYDGMLVSKYSKTIVEEIDKLIEYNSEKDDFIFVFPYSVIYKMQTERYEAPTFTPIYFFDVCSDEYAFRDLEIIKENLPKVIVWKELGEECWTTHETLFRGGNRLGQRDIQDWFEEVKGSSYELIGEIDNQSVWRLIDGTSINYTYFADEEDLTSNIEEVKTNIIRLEYGNYIKLAGVLIIALGIILCLICGSLWAGLLVIITSAILFLDAKPIVLLLYFFPLAAVISGKGISLRKKIFLAFPMGGQILFFFVAWYRETWLWMHADTWVLIIAFILEMLAILFNLQNAIAKLSSAEEKVSREAVNMLFRYITIILIIFFVYGFSNLYMEQNIENENRDMQKMQEIYTWIYRMRQNREMYSVLSDVKEEMLPALGSDGEKLSALYNACGVSEEGISLENICFQSAKLRGLSSENIFVRISGSDIFLWIQADNELGNSGHALAGNNMEFYLSPSEMETILNPEEKLEMDYGLLTALENELAYYMNSDEFQALIKDIQEQGNLKTLGSDGVNMSSLYEAIPEAREKIDWLPEFESELLRGYSEDEVYFRLSGVSLTVWIQPWGSEVGNSGNAVRSKEGKIYCVSTTINSQ